MIVRVLGEGQYVVDDAHLDLLNGLDSGLERAVESGDEQAFRATLADLLAQVRAVGERLPDESSTLDEVRALLAESDEGLIPG